METLGSREVYANPWLRVREDSVRRADGSSGVYGVVEAADIALVVPVEGDRVHLVEQYRHPVAGRRWEFPAGTIDPRLDVVPATLAARELREETGLVADRLTLLGTLEITPSTFTQRCSVFLATGLTQAAPRREAEEADMRSAWFTRAAVEDMARVGTLTDSKSLAAYALLRLSEGPAGRN